MKKGIGNNTNPDVNSFDVVLDLRDSLLDVRERCVIRELLARIINLALHSAQAIIDLLQLALESLNILADRCKVSLDLAKRVGVGAIVTSHALEVSRKDRLLARNLLKGAASVILQPFQLVSDLG